MACTLYFRDFLGTDWLLKDHLYLGNKIIVVLFLSMYLV